MGLNSSFGEVNLDALDATIADNAVDIFIYDTSKDSDGGKWRKRTKKTSWYNEELNTTTRGSRREFPAVAVIVVEDNGLTIYDGDDPDLPMWMKWTSTVMLRGGTSRKLAVKNGIIALSAVGTYNGLIAIYFISDTARSYRALASNNNSEGFWKGNIAGRNDYSSNNYSNSSGGNVLPAIVAENTNDVAMTVLPNAPVDSATGLPIPTIAVATDGGYSIIKDDGTVIDGTCSQTNQHQKVEKIQFTEDNMVFYGGFDYAPQNRSRLYRVDNIFSSDTVVTSSVDQPQNSSEVYGYSSSITSDSKTLFVDTINASDGLNTYQSDPHLSLSGDELRFANHNGIYKVARNKLLPSEGMNVKMTSSYNTGWMHGDIKGAFLSDTNTTDKTNGQTEPDRSVNAKGLQVYGTITKTPVATGADLVAYSGFNDSNYFEQPYNSDLNFGTGDFSFISWVKHPNTFASNQHSHIISKINPESSGQFTIQYVTNSILYLRCNASQYANIGALSTNVWQQIAFVRRSGVLYGYKDGNLIASNNFSDNISNNESLRVGYRNSGYAGSWPGSLALLRISGSAPSAEQIKKMYEDEKCLFHENAKCTLYGSSDAVTALAYDDKTNLLHVGTSSGRSDFRKLRRINNTTTGITTAISASKGLIAEQ